MYKLFLTLRYLRRNRIAWFAVAAVTLCTAMVLIVMSVMGGFLDMVKTRARGLLGDVVVDNRRYQGFPLYQEFIDEIATWPEVVAATPVVYTVGTLRFPPTNALNMVNVVGIRLAEAYRVNAFKQSLFYETYYPGMTHLGLQKQPLLDLASDGPDPALNDQAPLFVLPPPYQDALEKSRADPAVPKDDSTPTELNLYLRERGLPEVPGVYKLPVLIEAAEKAEEEWPGVIIGRDIVAKREPDGSYSRYEMYPRGFMTQLTLVRADIKGRMDTSAVVQPLRYADDSRTGIYEIDSRHVYCNFDLLQKLLWMDAAERADGGTAPPRCNQIQIRLAPGVAAAAMTDRLTAAYRGLLNRPGLDLDRLERSLVQDVEALTWEQSQSHVIGPVMKEKQLVTTLFAIISLVAVVLLLCILYMIVLQKTRDIGIIKSIGGSSRGVAAIFISYGAAVGVIGSVLGSVLGVLFVNNINDVQALLVRINPTWQVWDRSVYSFDQIPNHVAPTDLVTVFIAAIIASMFGAVAAAVRAGFMQPVEALRYE